MTRKYPKIKEGYWVYSIKVASIGKYYIGVSKRKECSQRWDKSQYKSKSLEPYLSEWDSMIKTVLIDGLTKEEALKYEDNIIQALKMNNLCINSNRSGLIKVSDKNAYDKQWRENNREKIRESNKQWRENNREKIRESNKQWRENNKEKVNEYQRQYYKRKKLEKQQQHTSLL